MLPKRSLTIKNPQRWEVEAREFAAALIANGERAWFEVRWPPPNGKSPEEWEAAQDDTFDAIELVDGVFLTLPPYSELGAA